MMILRIKSIYSVMSSFTITFTFPWTFCLCLFRPLRSRYSLPQISQENFMPWCTVSMWVFNLGLSLNPIPQILQMWGFSCKWVPKNEREKKAKVSMLGVAAFFCVKVDFFFFQKRSQSLKKIFLVQEQQNYYLKRNAT